MKCPYCGAENVDSAVFCLDCGKKLDGKIVKTNKKPKPIKLIAIIAIIVIIGCATYIGFNSVFTAPVTSTSFPVSKAPELAQLVESKTSGYSVDFEGITFSKAQITYILAKSILMINKGEENGVVQLEDYSYPDAYGDVVDRSVTKSEYIEMCEYVVAYMDSNGKVPSSITIHNKKVVPNRVLYVCCRALIEYENTGSLPTSVQM